MPALLKRVGLPVKYTDNAKLFISFINIGIVGCALLLFILYEPESAIVTYSFPESFPLRHVMRVILLATSMKTTLQSI